MKEKRAKRDLAELLIVFAVIALVIPMLCAFIGEMKNNALLKNTPLKEYSYFYSLDEFPKYKLEAAEMVEQLVVGGMEEKEACLAAIDATSNKIFADTVEFCEQHKSGWDSDNSNIDEELEKYMLKKQK